MISKLALVLIILPPRHCAGVWAVTSVKAYFVPMAVPLGFKRLAGYIRGENSDNVEIPMALPVVVFPGRPCGSMWSWCKKNVTLAFFLPFDYHEDPPKPDDDSIRIIESPEFTAYVSSKGGPWPMGCRAHALMHALHEDGIELDHPRVLFAHYDPPFRFRHRHDEVWVVERKRGNDTVDGTVSMPWVAAA